MPPMQRDRGAGGFTTSHGTDADRASRVEAAARRALAEAEARRGAAQDEAPPPEVGGRAGPEPVRYGDWEVRGLASDF